MLHCEFGDFFDKNLYLQNDKEAGEYVVRG